MTIPIVSRSNHFIANNSYEKASKVFDKINDVNKIEDVVSVQGNKKFDLGGVKTVINANNKVNDVLFKGDKILVNEIQEIEERKRKNSFMEVLKQKFKVLLKSEDTTRSAINHDATLLELHSSIKEAEQSLDFLVACRDKFVNLWKDLLNTSS